MLHALIYASIALLWAGWLALVCYVSRPRSTGTAQPIDDESGDRVTDGADGVQQDMARAALQGTGTRRR